MEIIICKQLINNYIVDDNIPNNNIYKINK